MNCNNCIILHRQNLQWSRKIKQSMCATLLQDEFARARIFMTLLTSNNSNICFVCVFFLNRAHMRNICNRSVGCVCVCPRFILLYTTLHILIIIRVLIKSLRKIMRLTFIRSAYTWDIFINSLNVTCVEDWPSWSICQTMLNL